MKKTGIIALLFALIWPMTILSQAESESFFDANGTIKLETVQLEKDTTVTVFHRTDDVVWSRIVYRIIDMRYKQNYQLYFPLKVSNPEYRSLFKVMLDAIVDGMPVYRKTMDDIKPYFNERLNNNEIATALMSGDPASDDTDWNMSASGDFLLNYDSITDKLSFNAYSYEDYVRNQIKFVIQEVVFFNKHTSRLYSKIMAIAPIYAGYTQAAEGDINGFLQRALLFWVSFDEFRPYLSTQLVMPNQNDNAMLTYDNFFTQKMYFSYLLGDSNLFGRMLLEGGAKVDEKRVRKEQERIETELLNFEQDLWEY